MPNGEVTTNELLEFLQENMATKDDLFLVKEEIRDIRTNMATKQKLREVKDELIGHIDGLVGKHKQHDSEIAALQNKCRRIERHVGMN